MAHIPKPALASCAASLTKALKEFNEKNNIQALLRLIAWPSYVLAVPPRGGWSKARRNVRDIVHRAELFDELATEELFPKEAAVPRQMYENTVRWDRGHSANEGDNQTGHPRRGPVYSGTTTPLPRRLSPGHA